MLQAVALIIASAFTGAALYVNVAEHPARMELDDRAALAQWKPSYKRGALMQASLALLGFLFGAVVWWQSGRDWRWLAGALLMLAGWPYTLAVIMPVNRRLLAACAGAGAGEARGLLIRWNRLHAGRTLLGALAVLAFGCAVACP